MQAVVVPPSFESQQWKHRQMSGPLDRHTPGPVSGTASK
jgi:hypothetical protein